MSSLLINKILENNENDENDTFNYAGNFIENLQLHSKSLGGAIIGSQPYIVGDINGKPVQMEAKRGTIKGLVGENEVNFIKRR